MARITHEVWTNAGSPHSGLHMECGQIRVAHTQDWTIFIYFLNGKKTILYIRSELQSTISTQTTKKGYKV